MAKANNKAATPETNEDLVIISATEETKGKAEESKAKKSKKVKIRLPMDRTNKNNTHLFVAVNGETYRIKRGETVEVPDYVEEVIRHSEEMADRAFEYIAEATENIN